ncbi:MAG: hypothetical protein ABI885_22740 [Gammaproteobacteria bacterium]
MSSELAPGMVLHLWFHAIRPFPKEKLCVLCCVDAPLFVLINSLVNPFVNNTPELVAHHLPITRSEYGFLDHDSWIDCSAPFGYDFEAVVATIRRQPHQIKGRLSDAHRQEIIQTIGVSRFWTPKKARRVVDGLTNPVAVEC